MKVAVFNTKSYDQEYFENYNENYHFYFTFLETTLHEKTAKITSGFDAVCVFVNDIVDKETIKILAENGVKLIALRCTGYNNVDLEAAQETTSKWYAFRSILQKPLHNTL